MILTQARLHELFEYDPETGFLTWKPRPEHEFASKGSWKSWNSKFSGKRAGCESERKTGYRHRCLSINGKPAIEHRVVWLYVTGEQPPAEIDHCNRDATDNRWINLRNADGKNQRNKSKQINNSSGETGITKSKQTGKWVAQCWANGRNHVLGHFTMKYRALEVLREFREKHGYRDGHGEDIAPYHR